MWGCGNRKGQLAAPSALRCQRKSSELHHGPNFRVARDLTRTGVDAAPDPRNSWVRISGRRLIGEPPQGMPTRSGYVLPRVSLTALSQPFQLLKRAAQQGIRHVAQSSQELHQRAIYAK